MKFCRCLSRASGKGALSDQIRALHTHLGVPIELLVGGIKHQRPGGRSTASAAAVDKLRKLGLMMARETIEAFMSRATRVAPEVAMLRKTRTERTNAKTDFGALEAWCAAVMIKAEEMEVRPGAKPDAGSGRELARMSNMPDWPEKLSSYLASIGIAFVALEHLPGTYLDGAAMCRSDGVPKVGAWLIPYQTVFRGCSVWTIKTPLTPIM